MQRVLRIAIVAAAVVLGALLGRRAMQAWPPGGTANARAPDLFQYQAEVELGGAPLRGDSMRDGFGLSRRDIDGACEGEQAAIASMRDGVAVRFTGASDTALVLDEIARLPEQCFESPNPPGMCRWAASELEREGDLATPAWAMLTACPPGVAAPFFDRSDAPAERVVAFVAHRQVGSPWLRPPPRLPSQYARAIMELASRSDTSAGASGNGGLTPRYDDPAAAEALAQAYESAPDAARRVAVALAMGILSNERARAIVRSACESTPTLTICVDRTSLEQMEVLSDAASYVERHPAERPRVLAQLEGCARGTQAELIGPPATCLARLATLDWGRAARVAAELDADRDAALAGVARRLTQFPSASDLVLALRTRQLLGEPRASESVPVTVASAMASYGRAWMLGPSAVSAFGHDRLARHLLRLGGLDDVEVDESDTSAGASPLARLGRPTRLRARSRGETLAVDTMSDGDFYDLDAVVGLLNVVARVRGANVRYLVVADPLAEQVVVLGPPGELASAVAEGLLEIPSSAPTAPELPF